MQRSTPLIVLFGHRGVSGSSGQLAQPGCMPGFSGRHSVPGRLPAGISYSLHRASDPSGHHHDERDRGGGAGVDGDTGHIDHRRGQQGRGITIMLAWLADRLSDLFCASLLRHFEHRHASGGGGGYRTHEAARQFGRRVGARRAGQSGSAGGSAPGSGWQVDQWRGSRFQQSPDRHSGQCRRSGATVGGDGRSFRRSPA